MYSLKEILRGKPNTIEDDINIIRSYIEYKDGKDEMKYIILELEIKDRDGIPMHIFKAVRFVRLIKLPDSLKESTRIMDIQSQILASFWENNIKFLNILGRIQDCGEDTPIGLLQLYGVQGVAETVDEAKRIADGDLSGLISSLQGSFRTIEFRYLNKKEAEWLRQKMSTMKHIQVVRGIPMARKAPGERSNKGMGGTDTTPDSEETSEQFAAGLVDHEFLAMCLTSPIEYDVLETWLTQTSKKQTAWASVMQGNKTMSAGINVPIIFSGTIGETEGASEGVSDSTTEGTTLTEGTSFTETDSTTEGVTVSESETLGENSGISHSEGSSSSTTVGQTTGTSYNITESEGISSTNSVGMNENSSLGESTSVGENISETNSTSTTDGSSTNQGVSFSSSETNTEAETAGNTEGKNSGVGVNIFGFGGKIGSSEGSSISNSVAESTGTSAGVNTSAGTNFSETNSEGVSRGASSTNSLNSNSSFGSSESWSDGYTSSNSTSRGGTSSNSTSETSGTNVSDGWTKGLSYSRTQGVSKSQTVGNSVARGQTQSIGNNYSDSVGRNSSISQASNFGMGTSMGIGASLSIGKSFQFIDSEVENIVELLEFQKQRLKTALHGGTGAFFTDMMIATETNEAKNAAMTAAKMAWYDTSAMIAPLQIMEFDDEENRHLLYHFNAFSPCVTKEIDKYGQFEAYKYTTILNADELTAYTHVIRLSDGGLFADIQNIPELAVPSEMSGEIYIGKVLSGYKWSIENGYRTKFDYRIGSEAIMHALFAAGSRSGKTVAALRFVAELANFVRRGKEKKRMRILALDSKNDWRKLSKFVEPERFKIYSMGDPDLFPFNLNLCKIPYGVDPEFHIDTLIDIFCRSYGLGIRSVTILLDTFKTLYDVAGVFNTRDPKEITERSGSITIAKAFKILENKKKNGEFGRDKADAVDKVLDRLGRFAWENGVLYKLYCQDDGMSIDEVLGEDDVIVLESGKLQANNMAFIFGFITASVYAYAKYHPGNFLHKDQYETVLVVEEANRVLTGDTGDNNGGIQGQSIFEEMLDQAAGLGLFCVAITQQPSLMPKSIIANAGLIFLGKLKIVDDVDLMITTIGREGRYDDRPLKKFIPKMPIGWFVLSSSRVFDYKQAEPVLVQVDRLDVEEPTNEELIKLMEYREIRKNSQTITSQYSGV
ncbi:MAG: serine-rich protein [Candidatus Woesearchaeota archaeon]